MDNETLKLLHISGRIFCGRGLALQLQISFSRKDPEQHTELWMAWTMHAERCKTCGALTKLLVA
jgi:hypothetical protein